MQRKRISPEELDIQLKTRKRISPEELDISLGKIEKPDQISEYEALGKGAEQGITLGFSDELRGLYGSGKSAIKGETERSLKDIVNKYKEIRDLERKRIERAEKEHPAYYYGGEIGTGIATSFIPGSAARTAAKSASLAAKLKRGAAVGALGGLGTSKESPIDNPVETAKDVAIGAGVGGASEGALHAITNPNTYKYIAGKGGEWFFDTPKELVKEYIENPSSIRNAPKRYEIAQEIIEEGIPSVKEKAIKSSKEARDVLEKSRVSYKGPYVAKIFRDKADDITNKMGGIETDTNRIAARNWLLSQADQFEKVYKIPANRIKDELQTIDRTLDFHIGPGRFAKIDDIVKKDVRKDLDKLIKDIPGYKESMVPTAKYADLTSRSADISKSPTQLTNILKKVKTDEFGSGQIPKRTLKEIGEETGKDYLKMADLSHFAELIEKPTTNGSKNVNKLSNLLKGIPVLEGLAPLIGHYVDIGGRKITLGAINSALALNKIKDEKVYGRILNEIIKKSNENSVKDKITLELIKASNPYIKDKLGLEE